jgi:hypothetical protein
MRLVKEATPDVFVVAVTVLLGSKLPLFNKTVTGSPTTGLLAASRTVTAALVTAPTVVLDGSVLKLNEVAMPDTEVFAEDPQVQLTTVRA